MLRDKYNEGSMRLKLNRRPKLDWSKRLRLRRETNKLHRQSLRQYADEKKATLIKYWEKVNELRVLESRRDCRKG